MKEAPKSGAAERQAPVGAEGDGPAAADSAVGTAEPATAADSAYAPEADGDREGANAGAAAPPSSSALLGRARTGWQRAVLSLGFVLQPVLLVCVALVLMQGWLGWIDRTYIVEARVTGARIVFHGRQSWRLEDALFCLPTERDLREPPPEATSCGEAHDPAKNLDPRNEDVGDRDVGHAVAGDAAAGDKEHWQTYAIDWPHGAAALLRMDPDRRLRIEAGSEPPGADRQPRIEVRRQGMQVDVPPGAFLLVSQEGWRRSGALLFVGQARLGTAMGSGETGFLLDGRYEVRERSDLTRLVSDRSRLASSGPLTRGDLVEIVARDQDESAARDQDDPAVTYGHLTVSGDDDELGFHAVAVSGKGDHVLQVWFYGLTEPVRIRPSWIDSLGTNPVLVALVVVLALFANLAQLLPRWTN